MSMYRQHPRNNKRCVFCNNWIGDAKMKFISPAVGYEYDDNPLGTCTKTGMKQHAGYSCQKYYEPSMDAKRLL